MPDDREAPDAWIRMSPDSQRHLPPVNVRLERPRPGRTHQVSERVPYEPLQARICRKRAAEASEC